MEKQIFLNLDPFFRTLFAYCIETYPAFNFVFYATRAF